MKTGYRVGASLAFAVVGALGFMVPAPEPRRAGRAHAVGDLRPELPQIRFGKDVADRIDRIELTGPDDDDPARIRTVVLEKSPGGWRMTAPIAARASASKVAELVDNLASLEVMAVFDRDPASYDRYALTEGRALHVVAGVSAVKVADRYFGKSVEAGQLARIGGTDGVFVIPNSGPRHYEGFLYTRSVRSWRDTSLFDFDEHRVVRLEVTNAHGVMSFARVGEGWSASIRRRGERGALGEPDTAWPDFDPSKVAALLRMFETLRAEDFGDDADRGGSGLDRAEQTGGSVRVQLEGETAERTLRVGAVAARNSRWSIPGARWAEIAGGDGTLYVVAPWPASWALADAHAFERGPGVR